MTSGEPYRAGVVAILGRPNAGKSTLLNRLVGQKLAIVTPKPQTTRSRILGILTREDAQLLLLDTPGMHGGEKLLNQALNDQVEEATADCDVALLLVDVTAGWGDDHAELLAGARARRTPVVVAGTKVDLGTGKGRGSQWPPPVADPQGEAELPVFQVSAKTGEGIDALLDALVCRLPVSPALYPEDEISDRPLRFLVAELVREAAFDILSQELPYQLATETLEFDESRPDLTRIRVNLIVTRSTQKQIVIGRGGSVIKQIGTQARREIERLVGGQVHLELWVKVEPKWSKRPSRLRALGYQ